MKGNNWSQGRRLGLRGTTVVKWNKGDDQETISGLWLSACFQLLDVVALYTLKVMRLVIALNID